MGGDHEKEGARARCTRRAVVTRTVTQTGRGAQAQMSAGTRSRRRRCRGYGETEGTAIKAIQRPLISTYIAARVDSSGRIDYPAARRPGAELVTCSPYLLLRTPGGRPESPGGSWPPGRFSRSGTPIKNQRHNMLGQTALCAEPRKSAPSTTNGSKLRVAIQVPGHAPGRVAHGRRTRQLCPVPGHVPSDNTTLQRLCAPASAFSWYRERRFRPFSGRRAGPAEPDGQPIRGRSEAAGKAGAASRLQYAM